MIPLEGFHVPSRLARTVRSDRFNVRIDTAFEAVVEACAAARAGRLETWINQPIQDLYAELYGAAWPTASSAGGWRAGRRPLRRHPGRRLLRREHVLAERDASKVALAHLVARLRVGRFRLLDAQFMTEHLASSGPRTSRAPTTSVSWPRPWPGMRTSPAAGLRRRRGGLAGDQPGVIGRVLEQVEPRRIGEHPAAEHLARRRGDAPCCGDRREVDLDMGGGVGKARPGRWSRRP